MAQPRMSWREKLWLSLLMIAASCWACGSPTIRLVLRPDTRVIGGVSIDSSIVRGIVEYYRAAFPNEAALCLQGTLRDTVVNGDRWVVVQVTGAVPAVADSSDFAHVYFSTPRSGCVQPFIGVSHDHPIAGVCEHSIPDALLLASDPRALFSVVFCAGGDTQLMLQDGRRFMGRWMLER